MKVTYFIYNRANGLGGHYRSLRSLIINWSYFQEVQPDIVHLGASISPVLVKIPNSKFFKSSIFILPELVKILFHLKKSKPDVLHCYDSPSYFICRIASLMLSIPVVYTKCGGKNSLYTPSCKDTVVFSHENFTFLKDRNPRANHYLIANRIDLPENDPKLIDDLKNILPHKSETRVVIRIGNIIKVYQKSIKSAFDFTQELSKTCNDVILLIVGKELDDTFKELTKQYSHIRHYLLDDIKYTREANKILYFADYVIGTGRGAMEGIGLGKNVYISAGSEPIPTKVTSENFYDFFKFNFSERSIVSKIEIDDLYFTLKKDEKLKSLFQEYCLAARGNQKILDLYNSLSTSPVFDRSFFIADFFCNFVKYFKNSLAIIFRKNR